MKKFIEEVTQKVLDGKQITYDEALKIIDIDENDIEILDLFFLGANKIREKYVGNKVELCTIMNAKSGRCSEDCKYCAQSVYYNTGVTEYDLLNYDEILERALEVQALGVHKFSLVTSGRGISCETEMDRLVEIYSRLKADTDLKLCASHGILTFEQLLKLKEAGVSTYHHNVETSSYNYKNICTTHDYEDRIETIKNAVKADLEVCCGGNFSMGESKEDRVKMAFEIKSLKINSIPLNILMPIKGTPYQDLKVISPLEILKSMALFRYINPNSYIRYAGGRVGLKDKQSLGFKAGVNAALVGNFLTTIGSNVEDDKEMIVNAGLEI
ncbi:biotin synthase BioB [Tepidibacter hydrothermalis]|uniref:Biotin synthase n=1 Tax=Tepidibacter hydrothermalis TaxID=3036126 RepID=A0ABY8EJ89_9FIRM|nr:biotin synthase BioB [Tepidibacter hydrothermalis]WFD11070.1 biotin synthase BioB [Tepidibacter hydrothermalis]